LAYFIISLATALSYESGILEGERTIKGHHFVFFLVGGGYRLTPTKTLFFWLFFWGGGVQTHANQKLIFHGKKKS